MGREEYGDAMHRCPSWTGEPLGSMPSRCGPAPLDPPIRLNSAIWNWRKVTGCLEGMPGLYGTVSHLDFVALVIRPPPTLLVSPVGVRPCS
jgi:hypothetical protein